MMSAKVTWRGIKLLAAWATLAAAAVVMAMAISVVNIVWLGLSREESEWLFYLTLLFVVLLLGVVLRLRKEHRDKRARALELSLLQRPTAGPALNDLLDDLDSMHLTMLVHHLFIKGRVPTRAGIKSWRKANGLSPESD